MSERQYDLGSRYEFESVLGRGGMGVVLRARDTVLNRPVAIKLLSEELAHIPEAQEIFLTEGRAMASLRHPNMVGVFDVVDTGSKAMMVFEFVDGTNFDDLRREHGKIDPDQVVASAIQLCEALAYLHENGFIHRDLKPANVMVQADGKVKLIDFGLARSLQAIAERGTRVRGSPAYMSPEQFTGDGLSASSDIYALGVTLFELLSGDVPFLDGDKAFAHVHREPPKLAEKVEGLHPTLYQLVDQCLAKKPDDRPESAREVIRILSKIASDGATRMETSTLFDIPATDPEQSQFSPTGHKRSGRKYIVLAVLIAGAVGLAFVLAQSPGEVQGPLAPVEETPMVVADAPEPKADEVLNTPDIVGPVKGILALAMVVSERATELAQPVVPVVSSDVSVRGQSRSIEKSPKPPTSEAAVSPVPEVEKTPEVEAEPVAAVASPEPEAEVKSPVFQPVTQIKPAQPKPKEEPKPDPKPAPKKIAPKEDKPAEVPWSF